MRLPKRLTFCTTPVAGDDSLAGSPPSPAKSPTTTTLNSTLSLQTLPSVPSLQSLFLLDSSNITLSLSLSSSISLSSPITSLSLSSSNHLFIAAGHLIHVYDSNSSTLQHLETFNSDGISAGAVKSVAFCNGKVISAHQDGKIRVWKLKITVNKHELVASLPTLTDRLRRYPLPRNHVQVRRHKTRLWVEHHDAVSSLAVNNKSDVIYSVSWDKSLKTWAPRKGFRCVESLTAHEDAVNALTVSVDGTVYTGSADGRIRVWGHEDGAHKKHYRVATLEKHKSAVNALTLNEDGSILFSGACDRSILVWEREDSGKYMVVSGALRGHDGAILCLINVSDFLISGSADRTVRIWRRGFDGRFCCLIVLVGHLKPVKSLAAKMEGDDGISIFSGGLDGEMKVWKVKINHNHDDNKSYR